MILWFILTMKTIELHWCFWLPTFIINQIRFTPKRQILSAMKTLEDDSGFRCHRETRVNLGRDVHINQTDLPDSHELMADDGIRVWFRTFHISSDRMAVTITARRNSQLLCSHSSDLCVWCSMLLEYINTTNTHTQWHYGKEKRKAIKLSGPGVMHFVGI